jgi:hypothetical protein
LGRKKVIWKGCQGQAQLRWSLEFPHILSRSPRPGGVLQEASKSGKLDEALELLRQEKEEVVQAAPEAGSVCGDGWDGVGAPNGWGGAGCRDGV